MNSRHMPGCASIECRICGDPMDRHAELNITRARLHAGVAADCDCELGELRAQRDELAGALETLLAYSALETSKDDLDQIAAKSARKALEKVQK